MAYIPSSGSVVAFQSDPTKLQVTAVSSITGGIFPISGSVASAQIGTQISSISGNVTVVSSIAGGIFPISGSVAATVTNFPANQSVSGQLTVVSSISGGIFPISGSVSAVVTNFPITQNVSGSVAAFQGTNPFIITGSVQGTFSAGNSSVQVLNFPTNQSISGAVTQGTNPWIITGSVQTTVTTGNSSVQLLAGTNAIGSVTALQGTNPWVVVGSVYGAGSVVAFQGGTQITSVSGIVNVSGSIAGTYTEQNVATSVTGLAMLFKSNVSSSVMSVPSPSTPLPVIGSVSGTVAATQQGAWTTSVVGGVSILGGNVGVTGTPSISGDVRIIGSVITVGGSGGTQYLEGAVQSSVTGNAIIFRFSDNSSVLNTVSPSKPLPISGNASVTGIMSVLGTVPVTQSGAWTTSVVGTVVATQIAGSVMAVSGSFSPAANQSVSGTVGASMIGQVTVVSSLAGGIFPISGSVSAVVTNNVTVVSSIAGGIFPVSGSVATVRIGQTGTVITSVSGTVNASVSGTVATTQSGTWISSISGVAYPVNTASGTTDPGVMVLGLRNDAIASIVGANLDYTSLATDSAGRSVIKPFASEDGTIISYTGSVVSTSVTLIQASALGKRSYITDFWVSNTGATTTLVTFQGGDTSVIGYTIAPTGGGSNSPGIAVPLKTTLSQDLAFKVTSASSIVYLTVKGYQAP